MADGAEEGEVVKGAEAAIGADWDMRAEGVIGSEGALKAVGADWLEGTFEAEEAAKHMLLDGLDTIGIGYMALWGF